MVNPRYLTIAFLFLIQFTHAQLNAIKTHVKVLCSNEFHGRGYVNSGDSLAAAYIKTSFEKNEITPLNENYYQSFFFNVNTFPGTLEVMQNGKPLIPGEHFLVHPSSSSGKYNLIPKRISEQELQDPKLLFSILDQLKSDTAYNAVLLDFSNTSSDTLRLLKPIGEQICSYFPIIELTNKKLTWSISDSQFNYPYIQLQDSIYQYGAHFQIDIHSELVKNHEARNVIGYVPSKKKSNDFIIFTAHYDHLGQMGENVYFPGANDNASGTALLLEMARKIKNKPLKVNAVFIAFAGEEAGLIGSNYFVNHPSLKLDHVRFLINTDIMGSGEDGITAVNATLHEEAFQLLKKINQKKSYLKEIKSRGPAANSDHYWFSQAGVPGFFLYTMGPNKNYHDVFDTYENLSFSATEHVFHLIYDFAKKLSK
jgi:hypothetical protein